MAYSVRPIWAGEEVAGRQRSGGCEGGWGFGESAVAVAVAVAVATVLLRLRVQMHAACIMLNFAGRVLLVRRACSGLGCRV
jgi:hypothetical protein